MVNNEELEANVHLAKARTRPENPAGLRAPLAQGVNASLSPAGAYASPKAPEGRDARRNKGHLRDAPRDVLPKSRHTETRSSCGDHVASEPSLAGKEMPVSPT